MNDEDRFRAASRLLDDPLVKEIFQAIEEEALNELLTCRNDVDRVECITVIRTIRSLHSRLIGVRDTYDEADTRDIRAPV
jgi:hypothetical protein